MIVNVSYCWSKFYMTHVDYFVDNYYSSLNLLFSRGQKHGKKGCWNGLEAGSLAFLEWRREGWTT